MTNFRTRAQRLYKTKRKSERIARISVTRFPKEMFFPSRQFSFTFVIPVTANIFPKVFQHFRTFFNFLFETFHLGKRATLERASRETAKAAGESTKSESSWIALFLRALASSILEPKRGRVPRNAKNVGGTQRASSFSKVPDP